MDADEGIPYDISQLRKPRSANEIGGDRLALYHLFGNDNISNHDIFLIEDNVFVYILGNSVVFENLVNSTKNYLIGIDEYGIGCIQVHPSRRLFAVGGCGLKPNIYIYSYPSLEVFKVLKNGAERGYASLSFNASGNKLASVSIAPDYSLTIWNWKEEKIELHSKAFGQDVFSVKFSIDDERRLVTCGAGHIRFWKTASTFTGFKLQGLIGKFGKIELSNISCFVEFPDGKVLSSTDTGALLLWEGGFIKAKLKCDSNRLCHDGRITFISHDRCDTIIITLGMDGYIRLWDFETINNLEIDSDNSMDYEITPLAEYLICSAGIIKCVDSGVIHETKRHFVVIDSNGTSRVIRFLLTNNNVNLVQIFQSNNIDNKIISQFHAGKIAGLDVCPNKHLAATCGDDGSIRFWDYKNRTMIANRNFKTSATFLLWFPSVHDSTIVGFSDGTIKILCLCKSYDGCGLIVLKNVYKPHHSNICSISLNSTSTILTTSSTDGTLFFFTRNGAMDDVSLIPLKFISLINCMNRSQSLFCSDISWEKSNSKIICSCSDGILREVHISSIIDEIEISTENSSLEAFVPVRDLNDLFSNIVSKDKGDIFINKCCHNTCSNDCDESLIVCYSKGDTEYELIDFHSDGTSVTIKSTQNKYSSLGFSCTSNFLLTGTDSGEIIMHPSSNLTSFVKYVAHSIVLNDSLSIKMSYDDKFILSSSSDGLLSIYCFQNNADFNEGTTEPVYMHKISNYYQYSHFNISQDVLKINEGDLLDFCEDLDLNAYSIQDSKVKSEYDLRTKEINVIHSRILLSINNLQQKLRLLLKQNTSLPFQAKLIGNDFIMDDRIRNLLKIIHDTSKNTINFENKYANEYSILLEHTLNSYYFGNMETDKLFNISNSVGKNVINSLKVSFSTVLINELWKYFESIIKDEEVIDSQLRANDTINIKAVTAMTEIQDRLKSKSQSRNLQENVINADDITSNVKIRKIRREERLRKIVAHFTQKPSENCVDSRDINAIQDARATFGCYCLKFSENYVTSVQQRIDVMSKKYRLSLIDKGALFYMKRFVDKEIIIFNLGMKLMSHYRQHEGHQLVENNQNPLAKQNDLRKKTLWTLSSSCKCKYSINMMRDASSSSSSSSNVDLSLHDLRYLSTGKSMLNVLSSIQRKRNTAKKCVITSLYTKYLVHETNEYDRQLKKNLDAYDEILNNYCVDKTLALVDLNKACLKSLTSYQEYLAILDFEVKDNTLYMKHQKVLKEKICVCQDLVEITSTINDKKDDLMTWDKKLSSITSTFKILIGSNSCMDDLGKIFKRKVNVRKNESLGDNSSDDDESLDNDNEGDENADTCPIGCDHTLFEKVLDIRAEKLSIENMKMQNLKSYDESKRISDKLIQKERQLLKDIQNIDCDLQSLQISKQKSINNVIVYRPIMIPHVYFSSEESNNNTLASHHTIRYSLFILKKFITLFNRIDIIHNEKGYIYQSYKDLKKDKVSARRTIDRKRDEIELLRSKCESLQILKFGNLIDLDILQSAAQDSSNDKDISVTGSNDLNDLRSVLSKLQSSLSNTTSHCVNRLNSLASISGSNLGTSRDLNSQTDSADRRDYDVEETKSLKTYLHLQRYEASQLRSEIFLLSHKTM